MANVFSPNGFTSRRRLDGAAWTANQTRRLIAQANTHKFYSGDPVSNLATGYIDVTAPGSLETEGIAGIFVGCTYLSIATGRRVWANTFQGADANADVTAYIIDDPWAVFKVWVGTGSSSAAGGPAVLADVGQNANFQFGTGNTSNGISGAYIDFNALGTTSTYPFTIVGLIQDPPGANGTDITTVGNTVEVAFNQSQFKVGTTGPS